MATLHPFTLIAVAVALPALAWTLPGPWGGLTTVAVAIGLCVIPAASSPPVPLSVPERGNAMEMSRPRLIRAVILTAAPFWLFLFFLHGASTMLTTGLRLTTMIASFLWLGAVLPPARLVEAMVAAGWPLTVAFLLSSTLSAVPVLRARAARIVDAQRCRGLATRGGPLVRLAALRALVIPLVLSALHEVDERALALETRGLSSGARRTPLAPPADHVGQRALRWSLLAGCVATLVWRLA